MTTENNSSLPEFVRAAKEKGASDEFLTALLTRRGWPADDVYGALGNYWAEATGLPLPSRPGSGESSRDAFLYLLSFATLATWATAMGSLLFSLIDHWFPDPVAASNIYYRPPVTWQMASIAVAFPIYLLVMRLILAEVNDVERLQSNVRKWLTYIALFLTSTAMICDLIVFLNAFLQGELSSRFMLKTITVMLIAGGIFAWYLVFLSWKRDNAPAQRTSRARAFAAIAGAAVLVTFLAGFSMTGSRANQRRLQADIRRVQDLRSIAAAVQTWHRRSETDNTMSSLPQNIEALRARKILLADVNDPESHAPHEYRPISGTRFEVCANFADATAVEDVTRSQGVNPFWHHARGRSCFMLDASQAVPY